MLLRYGLNDSEMVPVAPVITGITYFYIHIHCLLQLPLPPPLPILLLLLLLLLLNFSARFTEVLECHERKRHMPYNNV